MQSKITKHTLVKYLKQYTQFFTAAILMSASVYGILTIIPQQSLTAKAAFPTSRDPYQWPFSRDSIWNMPIHNSAQYQSASIGAAREWQNGKFTYDPEIIGTNPNDPVKILNGNQRVRVPSTASWNQEWNGCATFMGEDNNSLYSGQPLNLTQGGNPSWQFDTSTYGNNGNPETIKGLGITGCHGASHLSGVGGTIRKGEIASSQDIYHSLKINLYCNKYCSSTTGGYRWPAISADNYALTPGANFNNHDVFYNGPNSEVKMGSLLALKPDFNLNSLTSPAAKKVAKALMNYGGYVVDDTAWDVHALAVETGVEGEMQDSAAFDPDMQSIFTSLNVITNSNSSTIGGGANNDTTNRRAPLAPCFTGETNCTNSTITSSSVASITSSSQPISSSTSSCSTNPQSIINILPLGDSITEEGNASNSYRAKEWVNLTNAGLANQVKYVGLRTDDSPQAANMAVDHGGYGGYATSNFIDTPPNWGWDGNLNNKPMDSLMATNPDIIQIMLGTNDQYRGLDYNESKTYWTAIINKIRQYKPNARILIGHAPVAGDGYRDQVVKPIVAQLNSAQSPITMVEFASYDTTTDTTDGVHNDASGAMKMADTFAAAIVPIINSLLSCQVPSYPPVSSAMSSSSVISSSANSSSVSTSSSSCPVNSGLTKIASTTTYGASPSYGNNPAVTFDKAFDGNINTFYDYANANGGFSGIDINAFPKSVSLICFYPRSGVDGNNIPLSPRVNGGKFQGSNDKINYTDLATANGVTSTAQWYSIPVTNTVTYKYLRYLSPNGSYGNIAEAEFYTAIPLATNSSSPAIYSPSSSTSSLNLGILNLKVNLQGAYSSDTNIMRTDLKNKNLIPLTSPHTESPLVTASIPADTVDWILIEFKNSSGVSVAKKSGLLKSNGSLTESDGSPFKLPASLTNGNYNLIVKNRNHLSISTLSPINFINSGGTVTIFDFTTNSNVKANNQAMLANGKYGLKFGNANGDNAINAGDRIRTRVTQDRSGIYATEDINMDGNISSIDRVLARLNYDSVESI